MWVEAQRQSSMADFQAASEFSGTREGFFFGQGPQGLGYYRDEGPNQNASYAPDLLRTPATGDEEGEEKQQNDEEGEQQQQELHLDPLEDDDDPDARGKTYQAESLCMNCHDQGLTTFYVTDIPHFREIIISAFRCEHCGYTDTLVQPNSDIPTHGIRYTLAVTTPADLNRQVVKSAYCTIKIPELGFVIPKESQASQLSTVEGILQKATVALHESNEARKEVNPEAAEKVAEFVARLALLTSGRVGDDGVLLEQPFTFELEDPSGDSHIQSEVVAPATDPQLQEERYVRSVLENKMIGLFTDKELEIEREREPYKAPQGGTLTDDRIMQMYQRAEDLDLVRFACDCPACGSSGENRMCTVTVPHFREIILMCFVCDSCGFKEAEVKTGGAVPAHGKCLTLSVSEETAAFDLKRDVVKSATAGIDIPEIGLQIMPGTLGGRYITVEGIIRLTVEQLSASQQDFLVGDSATDKNRSMFAQFFRECEEVLAGTRAFTFVLRDPLAASWIYNPHAPEADPQIKEELYERTAEEESDLGLDHMNAPEDGQMEGTQSQHERNQVERENAAAESGGGGAKPKGDEQEEEAAEEKPSAEDGKVEAPTR